MKLHDDTARRLGETWTSWKYRIDPEYRVKHNETSNRWRTRAYRENPEYRENMKRRSRDRAARLKADNPKQWFEHERRKGLKHRCKTLGITLSDYDAMLKKQDGVCAICGEEETHVKRGRVVGLSLDHYHGDDVKVRGLLCNNCNRGLGFLGDNPENLWKAFDYLIKHGASV